MTPCLKTRGGGSLVLLRGCQRRTATQISMGVLSGKILKVLLEMFEGRGHVYLQEQEQEQEQFESTTAEHNSLFNYKRLTSSHEYCP
jgi:hypothetical protein